MGCILKGKNRPKNGMSIKVKESVSLNAKGINKENTSSTSRIKFLLSLKSNGSIS